MSIIRNIKSYIDSGNNGAVFLINENQNKSALKIFYSVFLSHSMLINKAKREFKIGTELNGIEGLPMTYGFHPRSFSFQLITKLTGIKEHQTITKDIEEYSDKDVNFVGGIQMSYMDNAFKLPKFTTNVQYRISSGFFTDLERIANEMLSRGYSLPPEEDYLVTADLKPRVVDFGNCLELTTLQQTMGYSRGIDYIKYFNKNKIKTLREYYQQ